MKYVVVWNYSGNLRHRVFPVSTPVKAYTREEAERRARITSREDPDAYVFVMDEDAEVRVTFHEGSIRKTRLRLGGGRDASRRRSPRRDAAMQVFRFDTKHNAELFQYAVLSHSLNRGKYRAKLDGFAVTTNAPEDVIDSAYKDLGAYGRDPARKRRAVKKSTGPYRVVKGEREVRGGLLRKDALTLAASVSKRYRCAVRVERVSKVGSRTRHTFVAAFGPSGKRLPTVSAFGKKMRVGRDVSRADLKHLSGAALLKLLRQAMKAGDEEKAEMIGKELDRRGKGFRRPR